MAKNTKETSPAEAVGDVQEKPALPTETFKADGKEYKFIVPKFDIPGLGVMTAYEALENDEALAHLVAEKSGVIQLVKGGE